MNQPNHPSAFLGAPSVPAYHMPATPPSQTQEGRVPYARAIPPGPANNLPALYVALPNYLTLTKPLLTALNLSGGSRIHLVVPVQRGGAWYLDTRPKPGVGNTLPRRGVAKVRVAPIHEYHFQTQKPIFVAGFDPKTRLRGLHFVLGEQVEGHEGYYRLTRLQVPPVHH